MSGNALAIIGVLVGWVLLMTALAAAAIACWRHPYVPDPSNDYDPYENGAGGGRFL